MPISAGTTVGARVLPPVVLRGARVLSPSSRDASSLAFDSHGVSWIGQDAPAEALFPDSVRVDAENAWVAPAFVERAAGPGGEWHGDPDSAARQGVVLLTADAPLSAERALAAVGEPAEERAPLALLSTGAPGALAEAIEVLDTAAGTLGAVALAGRSPSIAGLSAAELSAVGEEQLSELARFGVTLVLAPLDGGVAGVDLIRLTAAGVPLACSCRDADGALRPWDAVAALAGHGQGGTETPARPLSPRAAFTAATRGAARAIIGQRSELGVLRPGAPATFALWRTGELVAKAADDAVQRWSTDPRSGVPPMPDLAGEAPECLALVSAGTLLSSAGILSGLATENGTAESAGEGR